MKNGRIPFFKEKVENTDMFKSLNPVVQRITLKKNNLAHIEHGYTVSLNLGYDHWAKTCNYSFRNKEIIRQILKNEENEQI